MGEGARPKADAESFPSPKLNFILINYSLPNNLNNKMSTQSETANEVKIDTNKVKVLEPTVSITTLGIKIKKIHPEAIIPTKGSVDAAGYDLHSSIDGILQPGERKLIPTNISMVIPKGWYGRIAPRSGLAYKHGIDVLAGVIDSDYRGNIGVILYNTDLDKPFEFKTGDRIAQIIFEKHANALFVEFQELGESTERGDAGYGSTGTA